MYSVHPLELSQINDENELFILLKYFNSLQSSMFICTMSQLFQAYWPRGILYKCRESLPSTVDPRLRQGYHLKRLTTHVRLEL